jgi:hypothetical protein
MPEISDAVAAKAAAIQNRFNSTVTAVRADRDLTPEGKTKRLAVAYQEADTAMTKVREDWQRSNATTASTLGKDIFGAASTLGVDAISARDADLSTHY